MEKYERILAEALESETDPAMTMLVGVSEAISGIQQKMNVLMARVVELLPPADVEPFIVEFNEVGVKTNKLIGMAERRSRELKGN